MLWFTSDYNEDVLLHASPYMIQNGEVLNVFYTNMTRFIGLAHMLNRVAEKLREILLLSIN